MNIGRSPGLRTVVYLPIPTLAGTVVLEVITTAIPKTIGIKLTVAGTAQDLLKIKISKNRNYILFF